jgi:hypothetical protein
MSGSSHAEVGASCTLCTLSKGSTITDARRSGVITISERRTSDTRAPARHSVRVKAGSHGLNSRCPLIPQKTLRCAALSATTSPTAEVIATYILAVSGVGLGEAINPQPDARENAASVSVLSWRNFAPAATRWPMFQCFDFFFFRRSSCNR